MQQAVNKIHEPKKYEARLKRYYFDVCVPKMMEKFGYKNVLQIPKLTKIVVNMCVKGATGDSKVVEKAYYELMAITGQKPVYTRAKKSISGFNLREGMILGCMVVLRGVMMYEFLDRFINIALPAVKDFRGYSINSFDGHGNFSAGVKEQTIFPEIDYNRVDKPRGMDITFVTSAKNNDEAKFLLQLFNLPFIN